MISKMIDHGRYQISRENGPDNVCQIFWPLAKEEVEGPTWVSAMPFPCCLPYGDVMIKLLSLTVPQFVLLLRGYDKWGSITELGAVGKLNTI